MIKTEAPVVHETPEVDWNTETQHWPEETTPAVVPPVAAAAAAAPVYTANEDWAAEVQENWAATNPAVPVVQSNWGTTSDWH